MYLKSIHIKNIRGIESFKMEFAEGKEAGWHVLLGANGSGKTTVLRSIALALIGPTEILRLDPPSWEAWIRKGAENQSTIKFELRLSGLGPNDQPSYEATHGSLSFDLLHGTPELKGMLNDKKSRPWSNGLSQFSAGFGPYRRFAGRHYSIERFSRLNPKVSAHLTLFEEDAALTETTSWLKDILLRSISGTPEERELAQFTIEAIKKLINNDAIGLLPDGYQFSEVTADGLFFEDPWKNRLHLTQLSEGMRSILSLALEFFRLLSISADQRIVFPGWSKKDDMGYVALSGIVLIDEVDAHLHPDWQTRIGTWFRHVFPNIQFIVATHSPLAVRAAGEDSQIWWLPAAGSEDKWRKIENGERNRLVFGNVLDAFGTEVFGEQAERSPKAKELMQELAQLETDWIFKKIDNQGIKRIEELKYLLQL